MRVGARVVLFAGLLCFAKYAPAQDAKPLTLTGQISLPGVKGRIDHFSVDVKGQRHFMAGVGNHSLEVIDLKANKRVKTINNLAEPQGERRTICMLPVASTALPIFMMGPHSNSSGR